MSDHATIADILRGPEPRYYHTFRGVYEAPEGEIDLTRCHVCGYAVPAWTDSGTCDSCGECLADAAFRAAALEWFQAERWRK